MCGLPCITVTASLSLKIFVVMLASLQHKIFKVFIFNLRCDFLQLFTGGNDLFQVFDFSKETYIGRIEQGNLNGEAHQLVHQHLGFFVFRIAGQGKANPLATVWSASQLLEFFGHKEWADKLINIIEELLTEKETLTPDLGGKATTKEVGDAVVSKLLK